MKNATIVSRTRLCDRKCEECDTCNDVNVYDLRKLLHKADMKVSDFFVKTTQELSWGFGGPSKEDKKRIDRLISDVRVLKRHNRAIRSGYTPCLCPQEIRSIFERVVALTKGFECSDEDLIRSDMDINKFFKELSPTDSCIPYDPWERAMHLRMPDLSVKVEKVDPCIKFTYDIVIRVEKEQACKLLYDISVEQEKACDINYSVKVDKQECKIEYNTLVEKYDCDIDYDVYVELRECGLSYELISELQECGVSPRYDQINKQIYFDTLEGNTYSLSELKSLDKIKL